MSFLLRYPLKVTLNTSCCYVVYFYVLYNLRAVLSLERNQVFYVLKNKGFENKFRKMLVSQYIKIKLKLCLENYRLFKQFLGLLLTY